MIKQWTVLIALCAGCGGDSSAVDAMIHHDGPIDVARDGLAECNGIAIPSTAVAIQNVAQAAPIPVGGTLVPGTYVVTATTIYTGVGGASGPDGTMLQFQTTVTGTTYTDVQRFVSNGTATVSSQNGGYSTSGPTTLIVTNTCPGGPPTTFGYDATTTTFTLYSAVAAGQQGLVFTKQ